MLVLGKDVVETTYNGKRIALGSLENHARKLIRWYASLNVPIEEFLNTEIEFFPKKNKGGKDGKR